MVAPVSPRRIASIPLPDASGTAATVIPPTTAKAADRSHTRADSLVGVEPGVTRWRSAKNSLVANSAGTRAMPARTKAPPPSGAMPRAKIALPPSRCTDTN